MKVIQAFVIEKETNKSISFTTLEEALDWVWGNFWDYGIVYYDNNYKEHIYCPKR